jgi:anhydro-N-acetylmuramic acid kinase
VVKNTHYLQRTLTFFDKHAMKEINIIGMMSGTSLDGLDIAYVQFTFTERWRYKVISAKTVSYDDEMICKLSGAVSFSGYELARLNSDFGKWCGNQCRQFIEENGISRQQISAIASHGHTVFHQPNIGLTLQIGSGAEIAATTGVRTICDFRTLDVALGGQGAPLVPIGDQLLFSEFDYCLNLGGIANISYQNDSARISFDCCLANIVSNYLMQDFNKPYDEGGKFAASGVLNEDLLSKLNSCAYFSQSPPKSLGREFFESEFKYLLDAMSIPTQDKLKTFAVHLAQQVASIASKGKVLVTGGGAYNSTWVQLIEKYANAQVVIPSKETIDFKEAIVFAFLGVRRLEGSINSLKSVTGARINSCGGAVYEGYE